MLFPKMDETLDVFFSGLIGPCLVGVASLVVSGCSCTYLDASGYFRVSDAACDVAFALCCVVLGPSR